MAWIHEELKRTGVTLYLLWEEYHQAHLQGSYGLRQFSEPLPALGAEAQAVDAAGASRGREATATQKLPDWSAAHSGILPRIDRAVGAGPAAQCCQPPLPLRALVSSSTSLRLAREPGMS